MLSPMRTRRTTAALPTPAAYLIPAVVVVLLVIRGAATATNSNALATEKDPSSSSSLSLDDDLVFDDANAGGTGGLHNGNNGGGALVSPVASPLRDVDQPSKVRRTRQDHDPWRGQVQLGDDEDYDLGGSGSGTGEPSPSPPITTPSDRVLVYYRMTINLTSVEYEPALASRDSQQFVGLSADVVAVLEPLYDTIPGEQRLTALMFQKPTPSGTLATVDLGSVDYSDDHQLRRVIEQELRRGRIGRFAVSPVGFTFRRVEGRPLCSVDQFLCKSGECISNHLHCDGERDCQDGSDEDEDECRPVCPPGYLTCDEDRCLESHQVCDRISDCTDGRDEVDCDYLCSPGFFRCDNGSCIDVHRRCDGQLDCPDRSGADERDCPTTDCSPLQFRCSDGTCIASYLRCNGRVDCPEASDERNCPTHTCRSDQFRCSDGLCLNIGQRCDHIRDCAGGEDEERCERCRAHEFQCSDGTCISEDLRCNQWPDCSDGLDEYECETTTTTTTTEAPSACKTTDFVCDGTLCISPSLKCDRKYDCRDGMDELICDRCPSGQYICNDRQTCIPEQRKCDGRHDCPSGDDEVECQAVIPEPRCSHGQFQCSDGSCLEASSRCNGRPECSDYSDEQNCERCTQDAFHCGDGTCIDQRRRCDSRQDCRDHSDEQHCDCGPGQFRCDDGQCIDARLQCDNRFDCQDYSDEQRCVGPVPTTPTPTHHVMVCGPGQFHCGGSECIDERQRCNEYRDCANGVDERDCVTCAPRFISCNDGTCIDERRKCDGRTDCRDRSDEQDCGAASRCRSDQFQCADGACIDKRNVCNRFPDCTDRSDERDCAPPTCSPEEIVCGDGSCIPQSSWCDGRVDCIDGRDENDCAPATCSPSQFRCSDGTCIAEHRRCDGNSDCRDRSDEHDCKCAPHEFRCGDGICIDNRRRCDGHFDCRDRKDEEGCDDTVCPAGQFACNDGRCIDERRRCDGRIDCYDRSDELNCPGINCGVGKFTCKNDDCVEVSARCDGKFDCADYSDEADCPARGNVNLKTYPDYQTIHQSREVVFQCRDEGSQRAPVRWSRERNLPLPSGSTDQFGRLTMPNIQMDHTGQYFCSATGFPSTQPGAQRSVYLQVERYEPPTPKPTGPCTDTEAVCQNGQCIKKEFVCDRDFDCQDGSDELNCRFNESCEPNEFHCENNKCILKLWLCDGDNDCLDKSDEINCATNPPGSACRYDEYQCLSGNQCIPKSFQCDGEMDCQDRSDEIGCAPPTIVQLPPETKTVSLGETVTLSCRAIGNPVPLISWRLNWGHIPPPPRVTVTSVNGRGELIIRNVQPSDQGAYTCEAINNKESILGRPDTELVIRTSPSVCQAPLYNAIARSRGECVRCFCFGATDQCSSSNLFVTQVPPLTDVAVMPVTIGPDGAYSLQDPRYSFDQDLVDFRAVNQEFRLDGRIRQGNPSSVLSYWSLPAQFQGDKLKTFGGYLRYSVLYRISSSPQPITASDVVIKGNGMTIGYTRPEPCRAGVVNSFEVRFWEGQWVRLVGGRGSRDRTPTASREDIMMVLQNVEVFYVRASYDENFAEASLLGVSMDTAAVPETGQQRAVYVEQCVCPTGYTGFSCEKCASGYSRVGTGRYLGECRRAVCNCHGHSDQCSPQGVCENCQHNTEGAQCERCRAGYHGDARRGTPSDCEACPCPLTVPSNQFSPTCHIDEDIRQVMCDACPRGYEGRRCERCASGYQGNPMIPGDSCRPVRDQCDPYGSTSLTPSPVTRLCQCKQAVTGARCTECRDYHFHVNPHSSGGCVHCFCMGVTQSCSSSSWNRAKESIQFNTDGIQGFTLTTIEQTEVIDRGLQVNANRELTYRDFYFLPKGRTYYWRLPSRFIGDKVTSYGGYLNYTVRFVSSAGASPNSEADVQLVGNRITLDYFHRQRLVPNTPNTISIPMFEKFWRRSDGQSSTREHLMMALADMSSLLIKATYTSDTTESSLVEVTLETSENRDTGGARAVEVEHCRCPVGYKGLSCEDCESGFTRSGGGLYLGLCEPCFCNGHSSDCDPESGVCRNCQHNTEGNYCEVCRAGFTGNPTAGTPSDCLPGPEEPCRCSIQGSLGLECDSRKQCPCKTNVDGLNCNRCKEGTFHLESRNPEGCTSCFCFGITERCSSSVLYRDQVELKVSDAWSHGVTLVNREQDRTIEDGFSANPNRKEVSFRSFPPPNPEVETLFWSLPDAFIGNKLTSYGGRLKFMQRYLSRRDGETYDDADIIMKGNGVTLVYVSRQPLQPDEGRNNEIQLTETYWQQSNKHGIVQASRENFLMALSNLDAVLIRASFNSRMIDSVLGGVSMDIAVPRSTGQELAHAVEQCSCPPGYTGFSCEECAPGFVREKTAGPFLGRCTMCNCHGHSDTCDPYSGDCENCNHNTAGPSCGRCASGFFGDATRGTPNDCKPCPCPLTTPSNQFSSTCILDNDGRATCTNCLPGYAGRNCETCAPGHRGNPRQTGDVCRADGGPTITVRIEEPKIVRAEEGTTVTFRCTGVSQVSYNIIWTREGGSLPANAHEAEGLLTIRNVRRDDSGTYVCTGSDLHNVAQDKATLLVTGGTIGPERPQALRVWIEPRFLEVQVGEPIEFHCRAEGHPTPSLQWTGGQNNQLNPQSTFRDGIFRIPSARKSDQAEYHCTATNEHGTVSERTIIYVRGDDRPPVEPDHQQVTITPQHHSARAGETVRFDCRPRSHISGPRISWSRSGGLPQQATQAGGILTMINVDSTCSGIYICTITSSSGTSQSQARLDIISVGGPPTARIDPDRQAISQGSSTELRCTVTGDPLPKVRWSKVGEELGSSHSVDGTTLRVSGATVHDRGVYVCTAENAEGSAQASSILEVERREIPAIEIFPGTSVNIVRGGSALLQCRVTAGIPSPTITWERVDGRPLARSTEVLSGGTVLRFSRVVGDEAGQYQCKAENDAGLVTATASLVIQGLPIITVSPASPYRVAVGQRIHIECRAEGDPTPSVSWKQPQPPEGVRVALPRETPGIAILEINAVRQEDAGVYTCSARNPGGVSEERLQLIVDRSSLTNPGIETDRREFVIPVGSRGELTCFVTVGDTSSLTFTWHRTDGKPLPVGHTVRDGLLVIEKARKEDAGEYACLGIENGVVVFTAMERVHVVAPPRLTLNPVRQTAKPGQSIYIQCLAQGDLPINIEWSRIGSTLGPNTHSSGGTLQFQRISISDAGRYLCSAQNAAGQAEGVAEILINEEPIIDMPNRELNVFIGATVDLPCEVRGTPKPSVMWSRESGDLPSNSRIVDTNLRINSVSIEDAGRYYCMAANDAGSSRDYLVLNVKGLSPLTVHIEPSLDVVRMGDSLDVKCAVTGDPAALVSWSRISGPLAYNTQTAGNLLRITNVQPENGGVYRCQVDTYTGSFSEDYILAIQAIPSLPQKNPTSVETRTAPFGSTVVMDCRTNLPPPVSYLWSKQGGLLPADTSVRGAIITIPDVRAEDAGTYVCTAHNGDSKIDIPTILVVTGVVPYFAQAPISFMALPTLPDAYLTFDIEISFKPESPEGLILYNGQQSGGGGDFISFGLSESYAEFRFDVGYGPAVLRSEWPLTVGHWHTVHLSRNKKEGMIAVVGQKPVNGSASGSFQGLDLVEPFYVGGVPDFGAIHKQSGFSKGFVGCISRLVLGATVHQLVRDAQVTSGVTTCETCAVNPCNNSGVCQEAHTDTGHVCICPPGFSGPVCEKVGEACYPGVCGTGRCINKQEGGFDCYCPFGKAGLRCERDITITEPAFRDDAFVAYPTPNAVAQRRLEMSARFKPRDLKDGILLYSAQNEKGQGDFVALTIKDKRVEFRFDTGSGHAVLQSKEELQADQWVRVQVARNLREGTLIVNDGEEVRGKSPGHTRGLDLRLPLYVGGVDKHRVNISPFVEVTHGFEGCVSHIEVSGVSVDLVNSVVDAANVDDCGGQTPCDRQPCQNGGMCRELGPKPTAYECICQKGFVGLKCEIEEDLCQVIHPCLHGGTCVGTGTSYRCNCPLGYGGLNCEQTVEFSESARFQGDGYLEMPRDLLPHSTSTINEVITLTFETAEANGLLLWHGQVPETDGKGQDYLALSIVDGYLEFSYELGSGPAQIRSPVRVDDGNKHKVVLKRLGRDGSLELDTVFTEYGETQGVLQMLNTAGNIYLGGLPNANFMTASRYKYAFAGCIEEVEIQDSGILDLQHSAASGINVMGCEGDEESSSDYTDNEIHK